MKNGNQQNPEFRNYDENIKRTEKRMVSGGYETPSKKSKKWVIQEGVLKS